MADLSEFYDLGRKVKKCLVARAMDELNEKDRASVIEAFDASDITHSAISLWFAARSIRVSARGICSHRLKDCACVRSK